MGLEPEQGVIVKYNLQWFYFFFFFVNENGDDNDGDYEDNDVARYDILCELVQSPFLPATSV